MLNGRMQGCLGAERRKHCLFHLSFVLVRVMTTVGKGIAHPVYCSCLRAVAHL